MNIADSNTKEQDWQEAEIGLPYHKQGEDFNLYLDECDSLDEALELHAKSMDLGARMLRSIKEIVAGRDVSMHGCVHFICIEAEAEVIEELVAKDLAEKREFFDEEDRSSRSFA